ncbi:TlpA family protein disulfide reductase [Pseudodesulfovibrio sediminis]|uniref:Thioredoxin domain-containing protein n=1 Tax=Pseudodesulfovibrio sediminis TaxID=2810563 RepID=A0ABN6ETN1_9BACT|nr:TlpA disulfide reductase family protein [Pseudodesulfovibrio sediminis]BCS88818.1 hypothetical protein PSDVSF_20600 [Pseudodesulfovibrio sediminis]
MNILQRIAVVLLLMVGLVACSEEPGAQAESAEAPEAMTVAVAPESEIGSMKLSELKTFLADNGDKPTFIVVWTTWCPSCKQQLPELEQLYATHGDKANILAVSLDKSKDVVETFFEKKGALKLPTYWSDEALAAEFGIEAIPTLLIFNKDGELVFQEAGVYPHSMLTVVVDKMVNE